MDPSSEDDRESMNSSKDLSVGSMIAASFVLGLASNRRLLTSTDDEDFIWLLNDFFCKIWSPLDEEDAEQSSDDIESVRVIMVWNSSSDDEEEEYARVTFVDIRSFVDFWFFLTRGGHFHGCHSFSFSSKSLVFSRDDDADDDECLQYQSLKSFVVFLFSVL